MNEQLHTYMVFWSNESAIPPSFYWVTEAKGNSPKDALESNLEEIIQAVRHYDEDMLGDLDREFIIENLCLARRDCWISQYTHEWSEIFV